MSMTSASLPDARAFAEQLVRRLQSALEPLSRRLAALEAAPQPRDGRDGLPGSPGTPGERGEKGQDGRDGIDGRDGLDGAPGATGADGRDGIDGKDGQDGAAGRDGIDGKDGAPGENGRDGIDGKDGRDGFSLEQFDAELAEGGRLLVLTLTSGALVQRRELRTALMLYRGVYRDGAPYEPGDTVTWGGSIWHCNAATSDRPGDGSKAWTLAVKKGRDGKDGAAGEKGEPGAKGRDGRDLTQLAADGARY
jgi:Collagen triple helix repeat (20 copies)